MNIFSLSWDRHRCQNFSKQLFLFAFYDFMFCQTILLILPWPHSKILTYLRFLKSGGKLNILPSALELECPLGLTNVIKCNHANIAWGIVSVIMTVLGIRHFNLYSIFQRYMLQTMLSQVIVKYFTLKMLIVFPDAVILQIRKYLSPSQIYMR